MSMYHFSDAEAVEHDVNTVPAFGDFERVEIDGQWYVPERTCHVGCYPPGYEDNLHYEVCSECGTILTASRPGDGHAARASYCPRCGARVVG